MFFTGNQAPGGLRCKASCSTSIHKSGMTLEEAGEHDDAGYVDQNMCDVCKIRGWFLFLSNVLSKQLLI